MKNEPEYDEMKILLTIYEITERDDEKAYFSKVVSRLPDDIPPEYVGEKIDYLLDSGVVKPKFSRIDENREGRVLFISEDRLDFVKDAYRFFRM